MEKHKTGYLDICGKEICVGDIVRYPRYEGSDFTIVGEVKFGKYEEKNNGYSYGEYHPILIEDYYIENKSVIFPDWVDKEDYEYYDNMECGRKKGIAEIVNETGVEIVAHYIWGE